MTEWWNSVYRISEITNGDMVIIIFCLFVLVGLGFLMCELKNMDI